MPGLPADPLRRAPDLAGPEGLRSRRSDEGNRPAAAGVFAVRPVVSRLAGVSEISQSAELLFHLPEKWRRKGAERSDESAIVDRAALVDHDLAVTPVASDASR